MRCIINGKIIFDLKLFEKQDKILKYGQDSALKQYNKKKLYQYKTVEAINLF